MSEIVSLFTKYRMKITPYLDRDEKLFCVSYIITPLRCVARITEFLDEIHTE